jgi:hypothetical protein
MRKTEFHARREWLAGMAAGALLAACGGGASSPPAIAEFSADRADAFVGETVRLTARFSGGTARIEPGIGTVTSGLAVRTPPLAGRTTFRLIVSNGVVQVERELQVNITYRNAYRVIAQAFVGVGHATALLKDGSLLAVGGSRGESTLSARITRFDPATETFADFGALASGRQFHVATVLADGRVLVSGGLVALSGHSAGEIIDPKTGAVTATGALQRRRHGHTATLLGDGRVLVVGGWGPGGDAMGLLSSAEIWDPATGTFRLLAATMANSRGGHTATLLADGHVLIAGGYSWSSSYRYAERFDPATETFLSVVSSQQAPRALHAAHRLDDGSVLLLGGESGDGSEATAAVLRYDPARRLIEPAAGLLAPRTGFLPGIVTADQRVLLFGGIDRDLLATRRSEAYQPAVGAAPLPDLPTTRAWHTATRLADGRVLLLGGEDHLRDYVRDAVLYE